VKANGVYELLMKPVEDGKSKGCITAVRATGTPTGAIAAAAVEPL
jgi:hypothetical protein